MLHVYIRHLQKLKARSDVTDLASNMYTQFEFSSVISLYFGSLGCRFGPHLVLSSLSGEVLAAEFDDVSRVIPDDFLGEIFEDLREGLGDHDLLGRENSHLTNVCHLLILLLNFSNLI